MATRRKERAKLTWWARTWQRTHRSASQVAAGEAHGDRRRGRTRSADKTTAHSQRIHRAWGGTGGLITPGSPSPSSLCPPCSALLAPSYPSPSPPLNTSPSLPHPSAPPGTHSLCPRSPISSRISDHWTRSNHFQCLRISAAGSPSGLDHRAYGALRCWYSIPNRRRSQPTSSRSRTGPKSRSSCFSSHRRGRQAWLEGAGERERWNLGAVIRWRERARGVVGVLKGWRGDLGRQPVVGPCGGPGDNLKRWARAHPIPKFMLTPGPHHPYHTPRV